MSDLNSARRQFKIKLGEKQTVSDAIPALMGRGDGTVAVPNQAGMVYIRVGNEQNYGTAFNNRVSPRDDLPVFVGYDTITDPDRRLFQVLSIRQTAYVDSGSTPIPAVGQHHETHEYGGGDDVFVEWRRIMGLRVGRPAGTMAGVAPITVTVDPGYIYRGTTWILSPVGFNTTDLRPAWAALAGTQARLVLISLDSTGAIVQTAGGIVASPAVLTITNCPTPPVGNIPLAAVRLFATQTTIQDTPSNPDIIDLRFPTYATMGTHSILSVTHNDTTPAAIVRGDIVTGQGVAPLLARLALGGITGSVVTRNVTDVLWSTFALAGTAAQTYTFSVTGGTVPTGTGTSGHVAQWGANNTLTTANIIGPAANILTLAATVAATLTVPETGTVALLGTANSFTLINPLTTIATSWIGPSATTGIYFDGGNVGVGRVPTTFFDVYKTQNTETKVMVANDNAGAAAFASINISNGTYYGSYSIFGHGFTTAGTAIRDSVRFWTDAYDGMSFVAGDAHGPIRFYPGGLASPSVLVNADGTVTLNGGSIIAATATTWNLLNTVATTINFGGACTALNIGAAACVTTLKGNLVMADGATIGQAAGPLVAFDDTNNYLEITGCNVGIGTTGPKNKLDVSGNLSIRIGQAYTINKYYSAGAGSDKAIDAGYAFDLYQDNTTGLTGFRNIASSVAADANVAMLIRMVIDKDGNVGIGTTAPASKLSVNGDISLVDGMAAPGTTAGIAKIYVDTADGDLKVKFGDGTVKVLAADT